jgi:FlaA1/EpsC-like NDP-sugar epimerase
MVTGGGGSIGSELCRQIAEQKPQQLIVVDIYENNAYDIQQELRYEHGKTLDLRVEIASVRDEHKINRLFERYHPQIVFHAAAHKHVPLMEHCPEEAIRNNVFGTYNVAKAADKYQAEKFILISTDKAVNPTNVMGASKRLCEMVVQGMGTVSKTCFAAVRFGNVLGSNGSVIPLFKRQIQNGGPVTVTDKRIIRYFMTIPEAAQLVLQCGAMARQSEVFVLDMGSPVSILELAENLVRLSGYTPYVDMPIIETGLRPGEKLYEELLVRGENLHMTENHKIFIEQQKEPLTFAGMKEKLRELDAVLSSDSREKMIAVMKKLVPTYKSPEEVNAKAIADLDYASAISGE